MLFKRENDVYAKDKEIFKKINSQDEQNHYNEKRNWIRKEYEKNDRYKSLDNIRLEKERISGKLNQINSQFPALIIALLIMYLSLNIPAIGKLLSNSLIPNLDPIIQIILVAIVFGYSAITLSNTSDEFRCLRICKVVLEELEKEKLEEINNKSNGINDNIKDVKKFLGI
ncbi:hypothetical protein [Clostridium sp.]|uniref:hypothetical protein n=1 Tax=Clostridium sp. TaxID=1506 RepID=UPI00284DC316|nr:hypothetical protein [Clostridium sp.]MDR3598534.1 hypothetical protein [Clostridium sp.]